MNRRAFLQRLLATVAATVAPPLLAKELIEGELGRFDGLRIIGLDVAQGQDAAIAAIKQLHESVWTVTGMERLERPQSLEQTTAWVREIMARHDVKRVLVSSPRDGEMEAWRNYDHMQAAKRRRAAQELWEHNARAEASIRAEMPAPQLTRHQQLRAAMRERMAWPGRNPRPLTALWRELTESPATA